VSDVPEAVSERMRLVLEGIVTSLGGINANHLVQPHAWYDANYVGWAGDKVATWRGYRANLRSLGDFRTIYLNYVTNYFSYEENATLFGDKFAQAVSHLEDYICLYVTACPLTTIPLIEKNNFTFKQFQRNLHPSRIIPVTDFLLLPGSDWVNDGVNLIFLQRDYC